MDRKNRASKSKINPISLLLMIIITSFLIFLVDTQLYLVILGLSFALLALYSLRSSLKRMATYIFLYLLVKLLSYIDLGLTTGALIGLIALVLKLYPIFNIGAALIRTSPLIMMGSLRKINAPKTITIAFVTALRYLGELQYRLYNIRQGMMVRGLKLSLLHPVRSFELYLIPLIYKCLHVSETLTSSIISRGIEYEGEKTSYHPLVFGPLDLIFLFLLLLVFILWRVL